MASELEAAFDEAWSAPGVPREHYAPLMEALGSVDSAEVLAAVAAFMAEHGVRFGGSPFVVDALPRIISAAEWDALERGLAQRARALNRFLLDAYGPREVAAAGIVTDGVLETAEGFEPDLAGRLPSHPWPAAIIGFDVVRAPGGEFQVLEDNMRTPSGFAYAISARAAVTAALPRGLPAPRPIEPALWDQLGAVMRAAAPAGVSDPRIVVLTDGPDNVAYDEHAMAAEALGAVLTTPEQLVAGDGGLHVAGATGALEAVDVVYRRTNEDRVRDHDGAMTAVARLLLQPWLTGQIGLVNAFGNGLADDKLIHGHVEDFVRFYLGEEPLIRSVPTMSIGDRPDVIDNLETHVVKPRHGHGGIGVVIGPHADAEDLKRLAHELRQDPTAYIAQPTITLSVHPTVISGRLEPRHVDLRPFSLAADDITLMPGGLSRVAFDEGSIV
ncbi:MAG TPA: circularly permuted type 2 ATP-grasp protein, partial [Solirubrobacteraceae bacterium]|nr:circularly permuted type 2 ATP-grasp protein [Solirubrobacteraceae bacterium]